MVRLLTDEDFDNDILRGLLRRRATVGLVRSQDIGLKGRPDREVLDQAARDGRVMLTHDVSTMIDAAYERVVQGLPMPGLFAVRQSLPISQAIEELLLIVECSETSGWDGQVRFLPL